MEGRSLAMTDCWVNIMPKQVVHPSHLHPLATISGTYYVQTPKGCAGLKFEDPKNNTWVLKPSDEVTTGSQYANLAKKARMYLERVANDHPGTPWAYLAERELKDPLSWAWTEEFTDLTPRPMGDAGGNAPPPANDAARMLQKPPPKRPLPKL